MRQALGIIPKADDKVIKNPESTGYFIGVRLRRDIGRDGLKAWLEEATAHVQELVEPDVERGDQADVVTGFAPSIFGVGDALSIDPPLQRPGGFTDDVSLPHLEGLPLDVDVMFYVMSLSEARVARFLRGLWGNQERLVQQLVVERGYQPTDRTEAFGYADGLRNVRSADRYRVAFVHRDENDLEEPPGAEGGSYLVYMKITQDLDAFALLSSDEQDAIIGRRRDGTRLDEPDVDSPRREPSMPEAEPPSVKSHVRKAGPRGVHDDVQIFRRGLPFIEEGDGGSLREGLHFASFQASLDQFDVIFNDWMINSAFPEVGFPAEPGRDALFDGRFTAFERSGIFFCPPHDEGRHIGVSLFDPQPSTHTSRTGKVAIRKRVISADDSTRRFERGGFQFQIVAASGEAVGDVMTTDSKGHAVSDEIPTGSYVLREIHVPRSDVSPNPDIQFTLDGKRLVLRVTNFVSGPGPYGARP